MVQICDAVAVAGLLNATLVIPIFHLNSVWRDSRWLLSVIAIAAGPATAILVLLWNYAMICVDLCFVVNLLWSTLYFTDSFRIPEVKFFSALKLQIAIRVWKFCDIILIGNPSLHLAYSRNHLQHLDQQIVTIIFWK